MLFVSDTLLLAHGHRQALQMLVRPYIRHPWAWASSNQPPTHETRFPPTKDREHKPAKMTTPFRSVITQAYEEHKPAGKTEKIECGRRRKKGPRGSTYAPRRLKDKREMDKYVRVDDWQGFTSTDWPNPVHAYTQSMQQTKAKYVQGRAREKERNKRKNKHDSNQHPAPFCHPSIPTCFLPHRRMKPAVGSVRAPTADTARRLQPNTKARIQLMPCIRSDSG